MESVEREPDLAEERRQRNIREDEEMGRRALAEVVAREAAEPALRRAADLIANLNTTAHPVVTLIAASGIVHPSCPTCDKALAPNIREVVIPPGGTIPNLGERATDDIGGVFTYHGAIGFRLPRFTQSKTAGSFVIRAFDGTFGRAGYLPFCTLRCGLAFGRAAYKSGCRLEK